MIPAENRLYICIYVFMKNFFSLSVKSSSNNACVLAPIITLSVPVGNFISSYLSAATGVSLSTNDQVLFFLLDICIYNDVKNNNH